MWNEIWSYLFATSVTWSTTIKKLTGRLAFQWGESHYVSLLYVNWQRNREEGKEGMVFCETMNHFLFEKHLNRCLPCLDTILQAINLRFSQISLIISTEGTWNPFQRHEFEILLSQLFNSLSFPFSIQEGYPFKFTLSLDGGISIIARISEIMARDKTKIFLLMSVRFGVLALWWNDV